MSNGQEPPQSENEPSPSLPNATVQDFVGEIRRLQAESKRLKRLLLVKRPDRDDLQEIACAMRDAAFEFEMKANYFGELRDKAYGLLTPDNLPSVEELSGMLGPGPEAVRQAMEEPPARCLAIDPVEGRVADGLRAPESSDLSAALPPPVPGADQ